jgi:hypothetical protein
MPAEKINVLTQNTALSGADNFPHNNGANTERILAGDMNLLPQGFLLNGYIDRSVATNDLTVAVKEKGGGNPSATNPVTAFIGTTLRRITGSLSVTVLDATNTFNAGAAELATKEIDYFVYLGWRAASSTVFILISRIPYARVYNDFSTTITNEKYGAYSGSAPAATDEVQNIGRFNATLSAGGAFTWSVPATSVVISHPIYETRILDFVSTRTPSAGTMSSVVVTVEKYQVVGRNFIFHIWTTWTQNTTAADYIQFSLPFTPGVAPNFSGICTPAGTPVSSNVTSSGANLFVRQYNAAGGAFTVAASKDVRMSFIAALVAT